MSADPDDGILWWYECEGLDGYFQWQFWNIEALIFGTLSICSCIFIIYSAIKYRKVLASQSVPFAAQIPVYLSLCDLGYCTFHGGDHLYSITRGYVMYGRLCTAFGSMKAFSINTQTAWALGCAVYLYRNIVFSAPYHDSNSFWAKHYIHFHACCWGVPLLILIFGLALDIYGLETCWCGTKNPSVNFWITDLWIFIALFLLLTAYGAIAYKLRQVVKMTEKHHAGDEDITAQINKIKKVAMMIGMYPIAYFVQWFGYSLSKMHALPDVFAVWVWNVLTTNSGGIFTLCFYGPLLFRQIRRFKLAEIARKQKAGIQMNNIVRVQSE